MDAPALGRIVVLDGDGLGRIALDDGGELRFGRSACKGFEAIVGARVQVVTVGPHPLGGVRATRVEVAPGAGDDIDRLHDGRAHAEGLAMTHHELVGHAMQLGTVTVLLSRPPTLGRGGIRALFEAAGVIPELGSLELAAGAATLTLAGRGCQVWVSDEPLPREGLDLRLAGPDFDLGAGFVSISIGLPEFDVDMRRAMGIAVPDGWAPGGIMRVLTQVVQCLSTDAVGVVVHRAGQVVFPAEMWLGRTGDPDDPACISYPAWIDVGFTPDRTRLETWGMTVSGHENIGVAIEDHDSDEEYERAMDALMLGCDRMCRENRFLRDEEELHVPFGQRAGAYPLRENPDGDDGTGSVFRVSASDDKPVLRPVSIGLPPARVWEAACRGERGPVGFWTYRELLRAKLAEGGLEPLGHARFHGFGGPIPDHDVLVFRRAGYYAFVTCGHGRIVQPNGDPDDDTARIEFMITVSDDDPSVADKLSQVSRLLHVRGPDAPPIGPEHRISFGEPVGPTARYALGFGGRVELDTGDPITLLVPLPMTEAESAAVPVDDLPQWLRTHGNDPTIRERWLSTGEVGAV